MLRKLFGASALSQAAESLYRSAVAAARNEVFYAEYGVPDTVDGRFEMISLHVYVLLRRLKSLGAEGKKLSQSLFDTMFDDMDRTLREMGAGDLGVGRRVKAMAQAFYGRIAAYDGALADASPEPLYLALERNVFRATDDGHAAGTSDGITALASYLRELAQKMDKCDPEPLLAGDAAFPVRASS